MRVRRLGSLGFLLLGCGGATDDSAPQATGGWESILSSGGSGSQWPTGSGGSHTGGQAYSTYTAIGCPDAAAPTITAECDLFSPASSGCPSGQACYPTTRSTGNPCDPQQYYYVCASAGDGLQGDYCSRSTDCASGYVCVVSPNATSCQQMCSTSDSGICSGGMLCTPIDVAGVGTCS